MSPRLLVTLEMTPITEKDTATRCPKVFHGYRYLVVTGLGLMATEPISEPVFQAQNGCGSRDVRVMGQMGLGCFPSVCFEMDHYSTVEASSLRTGLCRGCVSACRDNGERGGV